MKKICVFIFLAIAFTSCVEENQYQYELDDITVSQQNGEKNNQKSTTEFISIAYADLFGTSIPQSKLVNLSVAYTSFGDLKVIEERIIRNLLNDPNVIVPAQISVGGDTMLFVGNTYKKLYNREPNPYEKHFWKELIRNDASVTPTTIYYALMTSDEYRFY